jgi:glycosyltransferase involved in cell wall biosynthesis
MNHDKNCHITLLIRSLECGGAERQLVELAKGLHNSGQKVSVLTFYPGGILEDDLHRAGIPVYSLDKRGRWDVLPFAIRLCRAVSRHDTQVLYAFLGISCIMSILVKLVRPRLRVVWGVRASNMDLGRYDWLARFSYKLECMLSRFADLIIVNSNAGKTYALANGFPEEKTIVIPNGIDTDRYRPDAVARDTLRAEWNITDKDTLIGLVARLDPMKDHPVFLRAAAKLAPALDNVRFVCVGDGPEPYRSELFDLAERLGLKQKIIWAGARKDMTAVYNAIDILVLSSRTEGFPNVIAEAMACGTPCVATDVGDAAYVIGNSGLIVSPGDSDGLADGILGFINLQTIDRQNSSGNVRNRILDQFSAQSLTKNTLNAIRKLSTTH